MNTPDSGRKIACKSCPFRENCSVNFRGKGVNEQRRLEQAVTRNRGRFPCHTDHPRTNAVFQCGATGANDCVGFQHSLRGKKGFWTFKQLRNKEAV